MKLTAKAEGAGDLSAEMLIEQLVLLPPDAVVKVKTESSQMDGAYWSVTASWDVVEPLPRGDITEKRGPYSTEGQWGDH